MPIFADDTMEAHNLDGSTYGFSAKRVDKLGATEYTLVVIAADVSGSVDLFREGIEDCVKAVVQSCRQSPRADNLMLRFLIFDQRVSEVHGYRPLSECNVDAYTDTVKIGGMTALYDAVCNGVDSLIQYGKSLSEQDFDVNAILVTVSDGLDNRSAFTPATVKAKLGEAVQSEALESIVSILVGVNIQDPQVGQYLNGFHADAGFTQYVELDNATSGTLAKLADFVSRSVSAQSQCLGSGGPSASLNF